MNLPAELTVHAASTARDGGTIQLYVTDEQGLEHHVRLAQSMMPATPERFFRSRETDRQNVPGRLYFNDRLVEVRSAFEKALLLMLQSAALGWVQAKHLASWGKVNTWDGQCPPVDREPCIPTTEQAAHLRTRIDWVISYVESDEYVTRAARIADAGPKRHHGDTPKSATKQCPACGKTLNVYAVTCRHCKADVVDKPNVENW
jgi:hypothetical protein